MTEAGKLYVVSTPIGNLGDMSYRAVEVLKAVDIILAEDTRTSSYLLKHYGIETPTKSFHLHNEHKKIVSVIEELLSGKTFAQIVDAGTPGISDPGYLLTREATKHGVAIECLPGATALVPALIKSGFPSDRFVFEGFLPRKKGRNTRLNQLKAEERTILIYESPHRLVKTLLEFSETFGERKVAVSRELTKKFEETFIGSFQEAKDYFEQGTLKGECVIVIEGTK